MIYKTPTLADALIVASLSLLITSVAFISSKFSHIADNSELSKLEEELKIERLKISIEHSRENMLRDKALKDARNSTMGIVAGKTIKF